MRVRLKGINRITKRLADGRMETYYYAWKGGPRLSGKPGSPEFIAAFNEAVARQVTPPAGTVLSILRDYQDSDEFRSLADRTKRDYTEKIKLIEREFGDFPLAALADPRSRDVFLSWRDRLPGKSRRQADYSVVVLALIFSWALSRRKIKANPLQNPGRFYKGSRREMVWSRDDEAAFLAPRRTCICLSCSPSGRAKGKEICCGFPGPDMTVAGFGFDSQRRAHAFVYRLANH
jgi:hypothetical protein